MAKKPENIEDSFWVHLEMMIFCQKQILNYLRTPEHTTTGDDFKKLYRKLSEATAVAQKISEQVYPKKVGGTNE